MNSAIPTVAEVKSALRDLSIKQLERLATMSGVPVTTIYKIRRGETENPGIETVRRFFRHIPKARRSRTA